MTGAPLCPAHPGQPMHPHRRRWAWVCPVERDLGWPSPQPVRLVNDTPRPVPLPALMLVPEPRSRSLRRRR